ncbi:hypothetical protein D3C85_873570 [compost metagenome]
MARTLQQIETVQTRVGALGPVADLRLDALQLGAGRDHGLTIAPAGLQPHLGVRHRNGVLRFFDQDDARDLGVAGHVDLDLVVGDIA